MEYLIQKKTLASHDDEGFHHDKLIRKKQLQE